MAGSQTTVFELIDGDAIVRGTRYPIQNITLVKSVGRGANGEVFLARDNLNREVAVKIWTSRRGDTRDKRLQGHQESAKLAKLRHPHIVTIFYADTLGEDWFFAVMEFVRGPTLRTFMKQQRPDLGVRQNLWLQIARAINHAHGEGIYHGDLHDRNVLIRNGEAQVIDFGTSLFCYDPESARKRESKMLISLVSKLFREIKPRDLSDLSLSAHGVQVAFCSACAFAGLVEAFEKMKVELKREADDDYRIMHTILQICMLLQYTPTFSPKKVLEQLAALGVQEPHLKVFLEHAEAEHRAAFAGISTFAVHARPKESIDYKLQRLLPVWDQWKTRYMSEGPYMPYL